MWNNVKIKINTISPIEYIVSLSIHLFFLLKRNTLFTRNPPMDLLVL